MKRSQIYRFAKFEFDADMSQLFRIDKLGNRVEECRVPARRDRPARALEPMELHILRLLLENNEKVLPREAIGKEIGLPLGIGWEHGIAVKISNIESAFRGKPIRERTKRPSLIQFHRGLGGYRLCAAVEELSCREVKSEADIHAWIRYIPKAPQGTNFVGRNNDLADLTSQLRQCSSGSGLAVVYGQPGMGKTSIALMLGNDPVFRDQFCDGVLWATLGKAPELSAHLRIWAGELRQHAAFLGRRFPEMTSGAGPEQLHNSLHGFVAEHHLRLLFVVDDVWDATHAELMRIGGSECATLLTTRLREVAFDVASSPYHLRPLDPDTSAYLLEELAPDQIRGKREAADQLAKKLDYLPLALQVAGRVIRNGMVGYGIHQLLADLANPGTLLGEKAPPALAVIEDSSPTVAALLCKSTDLLDALERKCFSFLGTILPELAVDFSVLQDLWSPIADTRSVAQRLVNLGLLEPKGDQFWMHSLLYAHAEALLYEPEARTSYPA